MDREIVNKFGRDLLVLSAASVVMYVGSNAADLGVPEEFVPLVGATCLGLYRLLRAKVKGNISSV